MDITQAKITLANLIKTYTDNLEATQLASDILNDKFRADFTALETAQQEANDGAAALSAKVVELTTANAEIVNKTDAIQALNDIVSEKQAAIDEVNQKIKDATSLEDLKASTDIKPAPTELPPTEEIITL
jgi:predicted  nucleic acid-binding Zn-ribbon protein